MKKKLNVSATQGTPAQNVNAVNQEIAKGIASIDLVIPMSHPKCALVMEHAIVKTEEMDKNAK